MSTIATTVYNKEEISLTDDTDVTLRPLPIGRLHEFMKEFNKMATINDEDDSEAYEVFINMTLVILKFLLKGEERDKKANTEWIADNIDLETMNRMFLICGGLDMSGPKETVTPTTREVDGTV